MSNYDDLLREKENEDLFNVNSMEEHWSALEKKMDNGPTQPIRNYKIIVRSVISIAALLVMFFLGYILLKEKKTDLPKAIATTVSAIKSAIAPPLAGVNVPYEDFSFDAALGDTLFTLNGSIIIFPKNALLNINGEIVTGNIQIRTREFNDAFDYSIAGIPMDYDSAGRKYQFVSSAMIDIKAYQNGKPLKVNPLAKPQLNLVSTNKEKETNLYQLDTVTGNWVYRGKDEVNLLPAEVNSSFSKPLSSVGYSNNDAVKSDENDEIKPIAPQKASNVNPVINISIDPASFKELLVYDGLKFEVLNAGAETVGKDAKTEWDNVTLKRGSKEGNYTVIFSAFNNTVSYNVKPVLEGKDFEAAEKLYQEKLKAYEQAQNQRKKKEKEELEIFKQINPNGKVFTIKDSAALRAFNEENKRMVELNKLVELRNKLIEAENQRIETLNKENRRLRDSAVQSNNAVLEAKRKQQEVWEQQNRTAALEQYLIRSFEIDGFGYWNCDQPTLPQFEQYVCNFKFEEKQQTTYYNLCIASEGINRIQNYYQTKVIGLLANTIHFGWAYNANQFYYFSKKDFSNAGKTTNPNTITISMHLYEGEVKSYHELKGFLFRVNSGNALNKGNFK